MTDLEAYEIMLKYSGGEKTMLMVRDMIHSVGIDAAVKNMGIAMIEAGQEVPKEYQKWMKQAFRHIQSKMNEPLN